MHCNQLESLNKKQLIIRYYLLTGTYQYRGFYALRGTCKYIKSLRKYKTIYTGNLSKWAVIMNPANHIVVELKPQ